MVIQRYINANNNHKDKPLLVYHQAAYKTHRPHRDQNTSPTEFLGPIIWAKPRKRVKKIDGSTDEYLFPEELSFKVRG